MNIYNTILENLALPCGDLVLGSTFIKELKSLREVVSLNEEELNQIQLKKLQKTLSNASNSVPFYNKLITDFDHDPKKWLSKFPIIDKKTIRDNLPLLISKPSRYLLPQYSSGSSGVQSMVYWSKQEQSIHRATQILWWEWAGYKIGDPIFQTGLSFNRSSIKRIKDYFFNTNYILAFSLDKDKIINLFQKNKNRKNLVLAGYASSLYDLALISKETQLPVCFKTAISWGDKLFSHYRYEIETAFSTKVHETYGTTEGMMIAAQKDLEFMYIMTPNVYLEILDDEGKPVKDGEMGNVVVTNLNGYAMPLIRFKLGDLAIKLPINEYPKSRELALPLLKKVVGRETDVVKTPNGKRLIVHSFTGIFEYIPEIYQFCVIQDNINGIHIQYIPTKGFQSNILSSIRKKILENLNEPFNIEFEEVSNIPPTPSGKPQIIISKL